MVSRSFRRFPSCVLTCSLDPFEFGPTTPGPRVGPIHNGLVPSLYNALIQGDLLGMPGVVFGHFVRSVARHALNACGPHQECADLGSCVLAQPVHGQGFLAFRGQPDLEQVIPNGVTRFEALAHGVPFMVVRIVSARPPSACRVGRASSSGLGHR